MAFSLGGSSSSGSNRSWGESYDFGMNYGQSYLDPNQAAAQQQLQNQYFNTQGLGQVPGMEFARQQVGGGLGNLGNRAQQFGNQMQNQAIAGRNMMGDFASQANPYLSQQIAGLAQDAGQFYNEQILPGIGNQAQAAGARGSSRQGIAEALGAQRVGQEFFNAAGDMRMNAYGQQQQAANALMNSGIQGSAQHYGLANQARMGQGQMANQFAQSQLQSQMMPFQIGSQVVGAPSVLNTQFGMDTGYSWNRSKGKTGSQSIGIEF